jgi:hypothetical protein
MRTTLMVELALLEAPNNDEIDYWFAEYYLSGSDSSTEHSTPDLGELIADVLADARAWTAVGTPIQWLDQHREPLGGQLLARVEAQAVQLRDRV